MPVSQRGVRNTSGTEVAGVVDQHIQPAEAFHRSFPLRKISDIQVDAQGAALNDVTRQLLALLIGHIRDHHPGAVVSGSHGPDHSMESPWHVRAVVSYEVPVSGGYPILDP